MSDFRYHPRLSVLFAWLAFFSILAICSAFGAPAASTGSIGRGATGAPLKTETVAYKQDTASLEGLLVYGGPLKGRQAGIVLMPDWMGVSDVARQYAEKVARLGYVVEAFTQRAAG